MKRSQIKPKFRPEEEQEALFAFQQEVTSRGACEECGTDRMLVAHHRLRRSQGGTHAPENGHCLCWKHHVLAHDHQLPDWRKYFELTGSNQ